jgi:hypothetical protein
MSRDILQEIANLTDKDQLAAIARAVECRLEELERNKGELCILLHKGEWYATAPPAPDGRRRVVAKLGPKLSPAAVLKQAKEPAPAMEAFELSRPEANRIKEKEPDKVGWWEDGRGNRRYYDQPAYNQARALWKKGHDLANHPLALAYGLSREGVAKLVGLEAAGYRLALPD